MASLHPSGPAAAALGGLEPSSGRRDLRAQLKASQCKPSVTVKPQSPPLATPGGAASRARAVCPPLVQGPSHVSAAAGPPPISEAQRRAGPRGPKGAPGLKWGAARVGSGRAPGSPCLGPGASPPTAMSAQGAVVGARRGQQEQQLQCETSSVPGGGQAVPAGGELAAQAPV